MQVERKSTAMPSDDAAARVIRRFGREQNCIGCNGKTYLVKTFYDERENGIVGRYECKCGYKQGTIISGGFVDWYREAIMGVDIEAIKVEAAKKDEEEAAKEAVQLPEVKVI